MKERSIKALTMRFREMCAERSSWEPDWCSIQDHILPRHGRLRDNMGLSEAGRGDRRPPPVMDETGELAADKAAAGLFAGLTNPSQPWHRETLADKQRQLTREERLWLDKNAEAKRMIWREAGIYRALQSIYLECATFGTSVGIVYPDYDTVIRLDVLTIGDYWCATDHRDVVSEVIYRRSMTAMQIVDEFYGGDPDDRAIAEPLREALRVTARADKRFNVLCYIGPNRDGKGAPGQRGKPWVSEYWLEQAATGGGAAQHLARRGFSYKPIIAVRWQVLPGDVYGRGCGHKARAACAQLQHMAKSSWVALDYAVRPPLVGPAFMADRETDMRPGAYNAYDGTDTRRIESMWNVALDRGALKQEIAEQQQRVARIFYNDILAAFMTRPSYAITAMEAGEISQEKLTLFAPVATRFIDELLIRLNEATQAVMEASDMYDEETGLVGPPPETMAGEPMEFEFLGPLAQAMKLLQSGQIERLMGMVAANAQLFPEMLEKVDGAQTLDTYAEMLGIHASLLKGQDQLALEHKAKAEAAAAQAEAAQAAQSMAAIDQLARTGQTMAQTPVGNSTALDAIVEQVGQAIEGGADAAA